MTFSAALLLTLALATDLEPIVIQPPEPIHGLVVDEEGRPVEGVELFLAALPNNLGRSDQVWWRGRSDAEGRFLADSSKAWADGILFITLTESIVAYRPGSKLASVPVGTRSSRSANNPLRIVLRAAGAEGLPVRVIGPDGMPVAGARVGIQGAPRFVFVPDELAKRLSVTTRNDRPCEARGVFNRRCFARHGRDKSVRYADA